MAKKFVSPGVFTTEIDQSFLATGIASIGAAVIGRTQKGPAFVPTTVTDFTSEFVPRFGDLDVTMQAPYAAKNYMRNSNVLTVVRVLGTKDGNSTVTNGSQMTVVALTASNSGVLAQLHLASGVTFTMTTGSTFTFTFSGSFGTYAGTASFNPADAFYVGKVLNTDPTLVGTYGHHVHKLFQWAGSGSGTPYGSASIQNATTSSFDQEYAIPQTPWIQSQPFGSQVSNLFRFWTRAAGENANTDVKVTLTNLRASTFPSVTPFGQFDVVVRAYGDTDNRPVAVETFTDCDLDPTSVNFVARRIGDQYEQWDKVNRKVQVINNFKPASRYVRIEMATTGYDKTSLPWGHLGYPENIPLSGTVIDVPYVGTNLDASLSAVEGFHIWGIDTTQARVSDRLKALATPGTQAVGATFTLTHLSASTTGGVAYLTYSAAFTGNLPSTASINGFTVAFYGGFDGWDMTVKDPLAIPTSAPSTHISVVSLKAAVDAISNPDAYDLNLLVLPGVTLPIVTDYARQICNDRADVMYIMDVAGSSVSDVIGQLNNRGIDDNYAACYYPDLKISDPVNTVQVQVKPSTVLLGVYAFNDRVGQPFFAPAGLNRGGLAQFGVVDVADRLTYQDRSDLYDNRINPIATFPNEGIVVFGQKTLQARPSALDRVNVRRLLIYAKKTIASAAKFLLFEPNNPQTWQRFLNTVNPILERVRQNQGIERFKVVMDSTVNTPDLIDRNIMVGKIFLQPTRTAEFIDLQFIISASGVAFEE